MTLEEADAILSGELGLLTDANERGAAKTYFLDRVCWQPAQNTRIARVAHDSSGEVISIRLCVSSDPNNSVFVRFPLEENELKKAIAAEVEALRRLRVRLSPDNTPFIASPDANAARSSG